MIIAGIYSFNGGQEILEQHYATELGEIYQVISIVNSEQHRTKVSREKTTIGKLLYSPTSLNKAFKKAFSEQGWKAHREKCVYPTKYYTSAYQPPKKNAAGAFREMDQVKNAVGVEVQFGKYAFMVYNVAAKMTIFRNLGIIKAGVEIVPIKAFAATMSSGVSYFEQFVWDLENRGVSNIDVPVLIIGVMSESTPQIAPSDIKLPDDEDEDI